MLKKFRGLDANLLVVVAFSMLATPATRAEPLTMFGIGQHSMEWMLTTHAGAQGIRSGSACLSCHEGEEDKLASRNNDDTRGVAKDLPASVQADLKFSSSANVFTVAMRWKADKKPFELSFMFDDGSVSAFSRVGCWAACHSDMRGMDADAGLGKYLGNSRSKLTRTGGGDNLKTPQELAALLAQGEYVELWTAKVDANDNVKTSQFRLLDKPVALEQTTVVTSATYNNGYWTVTLSRPHSMDGAKGLGNTLQTFGMALHQGSEGYHHWVSLPLTFGNEAGAIYQVAK